MRRLLALPLLACALFAPPVAAHDVPCHGVYSGDTKVGVCAGIVCVDLCGPRPVVHGQCEGVDGQLARLCAVYDHLYVG